MAKIRTSTNDLVSNILGNSTEPKFIPYGTNPQLDELIDKPLTGEIFSDEEEILTALARNGYALDRLADCDIDNVREEVAKWGYDSEGFLEDCSRRVKINAINSLCAKLRKENSISLPSPILKELCSSNKAQENSSDDAVAVGLALGMLF